jgi:ABC-2 type transport system permease protein
MITPELVSLGNEILKGLRIAWSERVQIILELPFFALLIILLGPLLGAGNGIVTGHVAWTLQSGRTSLLVLGFVPSLVFYFQAVKLFWRLLGEIQSGTLEQVYMSPLPPWLVVVVGRLVAALIETLIVVGVTYGIVSAFVPLHYSWGVGALLPAVLLILTGAGYSLMVGGVTLIWRRIAPIQEAFLLLVVVFAVSALPVFTIPAWFSDLGRIFPVTSAVASLYRVLITRQPVTGLWGTGGLLPLLFTTAAYLVLGVTVFNLGSRVAKVRGSLGSY